MLINYKLPMINTIKVIKNKIKLNRNLCLNLKLELRIIDTKKLIDIYLVIIFLIIIKMIS